ncbi:glycosyltransferase family 4 protein [Agarivorans sp. MS3-6]|uniref:glycosyltransferase family 4 protein n=1 Tax=Agarivorans sp. TSD2052 TaxID=2937286 RepID=UPI002010B682|nr:glycosyltransferase family 4 protein [Agarivorans sp. TSD2052]UPW19294.1 glycosyltransferase family 4 protein [Agarivorans sp. TSD2052]
MNKSSNSKISHVVSSLQVGGAERFVIDLCIEQSHQGMEPEIVSLGHPDDPLIAVAEDLGIKVTVVRGMKGLVQWRLWKAYRGRPIIHIHSPAVLMVSLPILPFCLERKIVYTRHGAAKLSTNRWLKVHQFARRYIDSICFVSEEGQQIFHQVHGWEHVDSSVIDNGIAMPKEEDIVPHPLDGCLRIGSVGRMVGLKHQISLLKALELLPEDIQPKVELHFFGVGDQLTKLQQFSQQKLSHSTVVFHGLESDRSKIYNSFELLAVTSETEGMSLAIMEAMAYKRAVVASKVGGNSVLVKEQLNGWLFDFDDSQKLADIIQAALSQPERLIEYGQSGRQRVLSEFSLQRTQGQYQKVYQDFGTSI